MVLVGSVCNTTNDVILFATENLSLRKQIFYQNQKMLSLLKEMAVIKTVAMLKLQKAPAEWEHQGTTFKIFYVNIV